MSSAYVSRTEMHHKTRSSKKLVNRLKYLIPVDGSVAFLGHADENTGSSEVVPLRTAGFFDLIFLSRDAEMQRYANKHHGPIAFQEIGDAFVAKVPNVDAYLLDSTAWILKAHSRVAKSLRRMSKRNQYTFLTCKTFDYTSNGRERMVWLFFRCVGNGKILAVNLCLNCHRAKKHALCAQDQSIKALTSKRIAFEVDLFIVRLQELVDVRISRATF